MMAYRHPNAPTNEQLEEFKSDLDKHMKELKDGLELLDDTSGSRGYPSDLKFASDLCRYFGTHDRLSDKQAFKACEFWIKVTDFGGNSSRPSTAPVLRKEIQPEEPLEIDGKNVIALFDKAAETLKYPTVKIPLSIDTMLANTKLIVVYRGSSSARNPYCIYVSGYPTHTASKADRQVLGLILRDGRFVGSVQDRELLLLLKKLIENFTSELAIAGRAFKHCCICGIELTDAPSLFAGYGPICAANWGLPWGDVEPEATELDLHL